MSEGSSRDIDATINDWAALVSVNKPGFTHRPDHQLVAALEDVARMVEVIAELNAVGIDNDQITVLYGPSGRAVLDITGSGHGPWTHVVRSVQRLGYDGNSLAVYDEDLQRGAAIVHIAVMHAKTPQVVELLQRQQFRHIGYFGAGTFEQFR